MAIGGRSGWISGSGINGKLRTKLRALALAGVALWTIACSGKVNPTGDDPLTSAGAAATSAGAAATSAGAPATNGGAGGDGGFSASAANGGASPTANHGIPDKIDLLFMIDNSISMQDKQELLKAAIPVLVSRLVNPLCVNSDGTRSGAASSNGQCMAGKGSPEFNPVGDIHLGIISSSLGAHGGSVCATAVSAQDNLNDRAHLIASMRTGVASWNNSGFLAWDPAGKANPAGESDPAALSKNFQDMITSVGEHGCGFEASLESWYRFLIDPEPPEDVTLVGAQTVRGSALTVNPDGSFGSCAGCDQILLAQRKAFLRPDSLLAIVMLSDENDCSIHDDGVGWFVGSSSRMPLSTAACANNPNDPCCRSCAQEETSPPSGCIALNADANCKTIPSGTQYASWDALHDSLNLRCFNQQQRFGFDLLYDTSRYVNALKNKTIALQSTGQLVTNPLYNAAGTNQAPRDPALVFLVGIVGVPWQDIADDASLTGTGLKYLTAQQLAEQARWPVLLGVPKPADGSAPVRPLDPFMIESTEPRTGTNPMVNVATSPVNSMNPQANAINGHEQNIPRFDDLQYACIFPLPKPRDCMPNDAACECSADKAGNSDAVIAANSPLCQGGANINQQTFAKAYPGVRELQVLKDFGDNAIVASICPKLMKANLSPDSDPNYGYNPAINAIIERLKEAL